MFLNLGLLLLLKNKNCIKKDSQHISTLDSNSMPEEASAQNLMLCQNIPELFEISEGHVHFLYQIHLPSDNLCLQCIQSFSSAAQGARISFSVQDLPPSPAFDAAG